MLKQILSTALLSFSFVLPSAAVSADEVALGKTIESRFTLALTANTDAAQSMLPEGWKLLTLGKGPLAGANTFLVFMNKHMQLDPDGKPKAPAGVRSMAVVNYAVQPEKPPRLYVTKVFEMGDMVDPYGNSVVAAIDHMHSLDQVGDKTTQNELWVLKPETGGELRVDASFTKGIAMWGTGEAVPYSSVNADYHRVYKYDQLAELAASKAMGKPLNGTASVSNSIPALESLLDGSEEIVGVMNIPMYIRDIYEAQ